MPDRPNILLVIADQLAASALACYGSVDGDTPTIDRLAARGVRFERAYSPSPLCQPVRAAFWTGRWPHQTGVLSNGGGEQVRPIPAHVPTLGSLFRAAGYTPVHFGKTHDAGGLRGFDVAEKAQAAVEAEPCWPVNGDTRIDRDTTAKVVDWLGRYQEAAPWFCVADLNNPHNICGWIGENAGAHTDRPVPGRLPEPPPNLEVPDFDTRPTPVRYLCCSHNRQQQTVGWTAENWRYYRAAYQHYTSRMDDEFGRILAALEARADAANTLIVFIADHGDGMGAHGLATKHTAFYENITRVPFIVAGPGIAGGGRADGRALVSLLDLLPTLCGLAGIAAPGGLWGRDLTPWLRDPGAVGTPHAYVASEWFSEWHFTEEPGRMLVQDHWKYTHYLEDDGEELYDLQADPLELRNLAPLALCANRLAAMRELLQVHVLLTTDDYFTLTPKVDGRWRAHGSGYAQHQGPTAPMVGRGQAT